MKVMYYNTDKGVDYMSNVELDQAMKNHPGFMPFTHCNTSTNTDDKKDSNESTSSDDKK